VQILELVIFAALAAIVLFNLYAVLGRRVGRQPNEATERGGARVPEAGEPRRLDHRLEPAAATGLEALRGKDPSFDLGKFLSGARSAYETIVLAFARGDRDALRRLTTPVVYDAFERAIRQREVENRSHAVEFLQPPRADLEAVDLAGDLARLKVRFLAEFRSRTRDAAGEAVDDRRTAEIWTFERPLQSRDPNWTLARVDAAQA
jgi:predicted lipid-binding transport protein (Tim44 family)